MTTTAVVTIEPLGVMLLVRPVAPRTLKSPYLEVVNLTPKPAIRGVVVSVGPQVREILPGHEVLFSALQGYAIDLGEPLLLVPASAVLATL